MKRRNRLVLVAAVNLWLAHFVFFSTNAFAQEPVSKPIKWGFEYDLMAPRIGAWNSVNLSAYIGQGRMKHSLIFAHINISDKHLTDESFTKDDLNAFGYRFEIYSHKELKRWSAGLIMLFSMHDVTTVHNNQDGSFNTFIVGVPLGYTWVLWNHLTINPNVSILVPLTNRTVKIGIDEVQQAPWGLEPGIRIGYRF
ncbi:MAG: hypothetical protein GX587_07245 [Bacteroidales bacterium]|nr:hypothetical protein [Bacteroidales bacterium]